MFRRIGLLAKVSAVIAFALCIRVAFAWVYIDRHPARALGTIPFLFESGNIAYSIATGHGFGSPFRVDTGPTAWMTPVYPLLLAGIFRLFGAYTFHAYLAAVGLNILFSTLTCVPIFFAGRHIAGKGTGFLAACLWAVFPTAILLPYESLWDTSLSALLLTVIVWATLKAAESGRARDWCGYGALWGFALMTNAALVSVLPFLLGWAGYRRRAKAMLAATTILLCCAPWTIRNYLVFHAVVPLRSAGGLALWLGTRPVPTNPISNQAERDRYIELGEIAYMHEKGSQAVDFILHHPAEEARVIGTRVVAFWSGVNNLNGRSARFYWVLIFNVFAAAGAIAGGIVLWRRKSPFAFPLTVAPVVFPLIYYFAIATARYRHPIDPVLVVLSAIVVSELLIKSDADSAHP